MEKISELPNQYNYALTMYDYPEKITIKCNKEQILLEKEEILLSNFEGTYRSKKFKLESIK